jgi:carbamoyl-phosphate synthase large subunit
MDEAKEIAKQIGTFPLIIRPAYTMGGTGGGIAYNQEEFETIARSGLDASPVSQILVEQSLLGWKEYELEVMRDLADNVVIICSIENLDPMGVHTGDSITVAPAQTLTDKSTSACAMPRSKSSARSASRPAAPTFSLRSTPTTASSS